MRKNTFFYILTLLILNSCEPNVSDEGINLAPLEFSFDIDNDSALIEYGDTIKFSSTLENIHHLNDGILRLMFNVHLAEVDTIRVENEIRTAIENEDFIIVQKKGNIEYNSSIIGYIRNLVIMPQFEDSLEFEYQFIPLKRGIFRFSFYSNFYESSTSKARTNAKFNVTNPHWEYYSPSLGRLPIPIDDAYFRSYLFKTE